MAKERTTINLDTDLLEEVRNSGVRNISRHIETLMKRDLRGIEKVGKRESARVQKMMSELEEVEVQWHEYLKRIGET